MDWVKIFSSHIHERRIVSGIQIYIYIYIYIYKLNNKKPNNLEVGMGSEHIFLQYIYTNGTLKDVQHHYFSEKCKSKPQCTTS